MARTLDDLLADIEGAKRFRRDLDREIGLMLGGWRVKGDFLVDTQATPTSTIPVANR